MTLETFKASLQGAEPPPSLTPPIAALWWDGKGSWDRAHDLVDELESADAMAVHAYLHRKEGNRGNADYWYRLAGRGYYRDSLEEEWEVLATALLAAS
jgi:hypothetical protein